MLSGALLIGIGALVRRLKHVHPDGATLEQITPQSMGATPAALESRDGRRAVLSITRAGREVVLQRRDASTELMARAL